MVYRFSVPARLSGLLLFILFWSLSCTSSRQVATPGEREEEPRYNESFDPVLLQDGKLNFPEREIPQPADDIPLSATNVPEESQIAGESLQNQKVDGFRVQLFATKVMENAMLQKKEAEYEFAEDDVAVYIDFDSPMYKVRLGDCRDRDEAETLRELARRKGFPTAFIVKTKVNTVPDKPQNLDEKRF